MDIFWTLLSSLYIFCVPNYKCPKCDQPELNVSIKCPKIGHIMDISLQFGCFLDIISKVGHVLGIILGFGHIFGHIMDTFGDFASKMCPSLHRAPVPKLLLDQIRDQGLQIGKQSSR